MKVTALIRTHEVRVGDYITTLDGDEGEVTQILNKGDRVILKLEPFPGITSPVYSILRDDTQVIATLEDDGEPTDVGIYGAGVR